MRPLLHGSLSRVRKSPGDKLVVGLCPAFERLALGALTIGLVFLGQPLAMLMDDRPASWPLLVVGLLMVAVSFYLLFLSKKLVFDRTSGQLLLIRALRKPREWRIEDIDKIELFQWELTELELVFRDGKHLLIMRAQGGLPEELAGQFAAFLNIPIERKKTRAAATA
jgi:hypothetical protein